MRKVGCLVAGVACLPFVAVFGLVLAAGTVVPDANAAAQAVGPEGWNQAVGEGLRPTPPPGVMVRVPALLLPGTPPGGYPTGGFPPGQCTYWVAMNHQVTWAGNAYQWLAAAQRVGVHTTSTQTLGAIVVFAQGNGYDALYGHVAIVVGVGDTAYTVSEMNMFLPGSGTVDERTIGWPDSHVEGFIL